jgi:uroporphyrinogen-III synthase
MILYLGIDLPTSYQHKEVIHYPIIQIVPRPCAHPEIIAAFEEFTHYTHLILTSKNAARLLFEYTPSFGIALDQMRKKWTVAVGYSTAEKISALGGHVNVIAKEETAEGVVEELKRLNLGEEAFLFWPHSKQSRPTLTQFFEAAHLKFNACIFYDTIPHMNNKATLPSLKEVDEIVFTSPSTIEAFLKIFGPIPEGKKIHCLGPITQSCYNRLLN